MNWVAYEAPLISSQLCRSVVWARRGWALCRVSQDWNQDADRSEFSGVLAGVRSASCTAVVGRIHFLVVAWLRFPFSCSLSARGRSQLLAMWSPQALHNMVFASPRLGRACLVDFFLLPPARGKNSSTFKGLLWFMRSHPNHPPFLKIDWSGSRLHLRSIFPVAPGSVCDWIPGRGVHQAWAYHL